MLTGTTDIASAAVAAERVREAVAGHEWRGLASDLTVTVSDGVAMCGADDSTEQLLTRADAALYTAKREGRNCVRAG